MIRTVGGRQVVRVASSRPTPYLVRHCPLPGKVAADLGCGNGRNSEHLRRAGFYVHAFDAWPDYRSAQRWLAGQRLPLAAASVDVVLCQFLLMFLSEREARHVLGEIDRIAKPGALAIVELEEIKSGTRTMGPIELELRWLLAAGWTLRHRVKRRCVVQKED